MSKPRGLKPGYLRWTPEADAFLREHYATQMPIDELVAGTGGHPREAVYSRAMKLGCGSRPTHPQRLGPRGILALSLAARPQGVGSAELGCTTLDAALATFAILKKRGMLFRAALGPKTVRWFTTKAAADRYVAANLAAHQAKQAKHTPKRGGPRWAADTPLHFTPETKYTYAPPPPVMVFRTNTHSPL